MTTRYFQAQGCNRWPDLFTPFDTLGGVLYGFCALDDGGKIAQVEVLLKQPKLGVSEITKDEHDRMLQKKMGTSAGSQPFKPNPVPSSASLVSLVEGASSPTPPTPAPTPPRAMAPTESAMRGSGAVSVDTDGSTAAPEVVIEAGKPVPSVTEALQTGDVDAPPTAKQRPSRKK